MSDPNRPDDGNPAAPVIERTRGYQPLRRSPDAHRHRYLTIDRRTHVAQCLIAAGLAVLGSEFVSDDRILEAYRRIASTVPTAAD